MAWPPVDPSVISELARFDPAISLAAAETPPSSWYTWPAFAALERRAVFGRTWQLAARVDELIAPGSYVAGAVADLPFVVVRGDDGVLRAFHNACRHRATAVATGCGVATELACPYHGWRYRLDGALASAPRTAGLAGFDRARLSLPPLAVATWGPLVLIHADPGAAPLAADVAELDPPLTASNWERAVFHSRRVWDLACDWKVFCDNYLDGGYHVTTAHPSLADQLDLGTYRTECFARASLQTSAASPTGDARIGAGALYAWIHPNLMINRYGPVLDTNLVVPTGPASCRVIFDFYFDPAALADDAFIAATIAQSELTQREDVALCESVQRGLASPSYDRGPYAPRVEAAAHHFHRLLASDLASALGG